MDLANLSPDAVAVIGFVALFTLMLLRVPVGMAMGLVGVCGYSYIAGSGPALKLIGQTSMRTVTDYTFGVIPMFMLMGAFVSVSGVSRELFRAANAFIGHLRGGLGMATVIACGGFAAICGSSVATAATFSSVAYPEMRRFGYPQSFSTGVIAAAPWAPCCRRLLCWRFTPSSRNKTLANYSWPASFPACSPWPCMC